MFLIPQKSARHVRAGQAGAESRWGDPANRKVVRIDSLTPEQRGLVLALIAAQRGAVKRESEGTP